MAVLFMDGFDTYGDADHLDGRWTRGSTSTGRVDVDTTGGRNGGGCLKITPNDANGWAYCTVAGSPTTIIIAAAIHHTTALGSQTPGLFQAQTSGGTAIFTVRRTGASLVEVREGSMTGTVRATSSSALSTSGYSYLEVKVVIHATTGSVTIYIDGAEVASETNVDTEGASGGVGRIRLGNEVSGMTCVVRYDDFVVIDTAGDAPTDRVGDVSVNKRLPNADTSLIEWTPSTGVDNYATVDDPTSNEGDYNETSTDDATDLFEGAATGLSSGDILAVQIVTVARQPTPGARTLKHVIKSQGNLDETASGISLSSSAYQSQATIFSTDPATSAPWEIAAVDTLEFGYKAA